MAATTKTNSGKISAWNLLYAGIQLYMALFEDNPSIYTFTTDGNQTITTTSACDYINGCRIKLSNVGGGLPGNSDSTTTYRVIQKSGNSFKVCLESTYNPANQTGTPITFSSAGSGTNTVTEQPLGVQDRLAVWARKEVDYDGSGRQGYLFSAIAEGQAYPIQSQMILPNDAIAYRYWAIIRGTSATAGDGTGTMDEFYDLGSTELIDSSGNGKEFKFQPTI